METNWDDWPICPDCGRRRQTVCPVCSTAGIEFDLAEFLAPAEPLVQLGSPESASPEAESPPLETLLMCPQCDEAFRPRFYDQCQQCGHQFEDGLPIPRHEHASLSPRVLWALCLLVAIPLGLLLYFWWLLR